jgi:hypothetical protein
MDGGRIDRGAADERRLACACGCRQTSPATQKAAVVGIASLVSLLVAANVGSWGAYKDATGEAAHTSAASLYSTRLHPQCSAPFITLGTPTREGEPSEHNQQDHTVDLTARLDRSTSCLSTTGLPIRRCGAASQSSFGWGGEPGFAIDGLYSEGKYADDQHTFCSHTSGDEAHPWWQLDLGSVAEVERVTVWGRLDCCANRLGWASVIVSATSDYMDGGLLCRGVRGNFFDSNPSKDFECGHAVGQYITVALLEPPAGDERIITICEMGAWGRYMQGSIDGQEEGEEYRAALQQQCVDPEHEPYWRRLSDETGGSLRWRNRLRQLLSPSFGHIEHNFSERAWHRFGGIYDALPTEPVRQPWNNENVVRQTCGAASSAWVSGWDPNIPTSEYFTVQEAL